MHGDQRVLELLKQAFGKLDRPAHFTDVSHCDECAEQDTRLRLCNPRALSFEDVARAAFDPFCVASPQALGYFFPALAKLALAPPSPDHGWYASQLLFHLQVDEVDNRFYRYCNDSQRVAVARLLAHLLETRASLALADLATERFIQCHRLWSAPRIDGQLLN